MLPEIVPPNTTLLSMKKLKEIEFEMYSRASRIRIVSHEISHFYINEPENGGRNGDGRIYVSTRNASECLHNN